MKKLMMAVAIVCAAVGIQAAAVDWTIKGVGDGYKTGNMMVYTFVGDVTGAASTALSSETATDWSSFLDTGTSAGKISTRGSLSGSVNDLGSSDNKMTFILVDTAVADGNKWYVMAADDISAYKYEGAQSAEKFETALSSLASSGVFKAGGAPGPDPVPEPTSALLLLLGTAGLALRRRA